MPGAERRSSIMKLRAKTLLIVLATIVCLLLILHLITQRVMLSGFARVEDSNTRRNVQRVHDALAQSIDNLSVKASDWAKWDDTYAFIEDRNAEYIDANLTDESLAELKLNFMFFINNRRELVIGKWYDYNIDSGGTIAADQLWTILPDSSLWSHDSVGSVKAGIIMLDKGPLCIVSRPILTSSSEGPVHGALIFARYLDSAEVAKLAQVTHLRLDVRRWDDRALPADMTAMRQRIAGGEAIIVNPLDQEMVAGYSSIADIHDKPALLLRVDIAREIFKQGRLTAVYMIAALFGASLCFGAIIMLLLERLVLSRVARLDADVNTIGKSGDHAARVAVQGRDELTNLAKSVNVMLSAIDQAHQVIEARNAEMRLLMNTIPDGLLSFDDQLRTNPEYSRSCEVLLGRTRLEGLPLFDVFGLSDGKMRTVITDFLDLLRQGILAEKELAPLNPLSEIRLDSSNGAGARWLRTQFFLIDRGQGKAKHILCVIEDITEAKALAAQVAKSEKENMQLRAIAEDPDLFRDFLSEMKKILDRAHDRLGELSRASNRRPIVNELFRDVHTIKGTAGSFGLSAVSEISGRMENDLSPLRESGAMTEEMLAKTRESLGLLSRAMMDVVEGTKKILGDDAVDSTDIHLRISLAKLASEAATVQSLVERELVDAARAKRLAGAIARRLTALRCIPARKGFARALRIVPGLIQRLGKNVVFDFTGADVPIDVEAARDLTTALVHLIRNSFDHGIESAEERLERGKPEAGHVVLSVTEEGDGTVVAIEDDGKGIDPARLRAVSVKKGILSAEEAERLTTQECYDLIFRPGFSTADSVTDVSGRGVGLDAVKEAICQKLRGSIVIDSKVGKGTRFTMRMRSAQCA